MINDKGGDVIGERECSAMTRSGKTHKATARMFDGSKREEASAEGLTGNL